MDTEQKESRERLLSIIRDTFDEDRVTALNKMYEDYGEELLNAPASGKLHYHNCFPGGYLDHVLQVHDIALEMTRVLKKNGGWTDYTRAELVMAALHHDLGKLGTPGKPHYIPERSDWHREKLAQYYQRDDTAAYMRITDRTFFVLQQYGVVLTQKEYLAIKLADGLYEKGNDQYFDNYDKFPVQTNLPYVIHWADHMSTVAERSPILRHWVNNGSLPT